MRLEDEILQKTAHLRSTEHSSYHSFQDNQNLSHAGKIFFSPTGPYHNIASGSAPDSEFFLPDLFSEEAAPEMLAAREVEKC